jgi:hypothetical protein
MRPQRLLPQAVIDLGAGIPPVGAIIAIHNTGLEDNLLLDLTQQMGLIRNPFSLFWLVLNALLVVQSIRCI